MAEVRSCELGYSLAQQWFEIFCIVGLPWLHHGQYLADVAMVTMETTASSLL
jgi:hypothetical protein